jgi:chromosomal replication initiation ATPase DnaA
MAPRPRPALIRAPPTPKYNDQPKAADLSQAPQIPLPLGLAAKAADDFLIGPCNRLAVEALLGRPAWPGPVIYLHGAPASGKTHLASLWAERCGGTVIAASELAERDNPGRCMAIDGIDSLQSEVALFHVINDVMLGGGALLLTARTPPAGLEVNLPDLRTRIRSANVLKITEPDEAFLAQLIVNLAERAQLGVDPALADLCVARMERTQRAAVNLIAALDRRSLAAGTAIRRETVMAALEDLAAGQSHF